MNHHHHHHHHHNGRINTNTAIQAMALDGIVNVNSLFTLAVFLGLSLNANDPKNTLVTTPSCAATSSSVAKGLVTYHVYSFSSFLFSSIISLALKQNIYRDENHELEATQSDHLGIARVNIKILQGGILFSALGSVFGCLFLMMALVNLVQIKLGRIECWDWYTAAAIGPLVTLVPCALLVYIYVVLHAFTR